MKLVSSNELSCYGLFQKFGSGGSDAQEKYGFKEKIGNIDRKVFSK